MKKLVLLLTPIVVLWFLVLGGFAWYFLRDRTAPLTHPPAHGVAFELEVDRFSLVGHTNGLVSLKEAYTKRFASLGIRFFWEEQTNSRVRVIVEPRLNPTQLAMVTNALVHRGKLELRLVHPDSERLVSEGQPVPGYVQIATPPGNARPETLFVSFLIEPGLQPDPIQTAMVIRGHLGEPQISFQLTPRAANAFAKLTAENVGRRLAIIVDGQLMSAPAIQSPISAGMGMISGHFTPEEAMDLVRSLESPLPAQVTLIEIHER